MNTIELKNDLHSLIDKVNDATILSKQLNDEYFLG